MKTRNPLSPFRAILVASSALSISVGILAAETVVSDDFSGSQLSGKWNVAKGSWTLSEGKLKGVELDADKHAAVATYAAPHTDSKVTFTSQLAGSTGFHLSFNHAKGHLFRVIVTEKEVSVRTDKDKKDPASVSEVIGKTGLLTRQGETHTLTCETSGDRISLQIDGKEVVSGRHSALTSPKTGYRLVVQGTGVLFDDFSARLPDPK